MQRFLNREGFRPLSGLSLPQRRLEWMRTSSVYLFPSPLGVISSSTGLEFYFTNSVQQFPSPLGVISSSTTSLTTLYTVYCVSVPSRGYLFLNDIKTKQRHATATRFRPLSGLSLPQRLLITGIRIISQRFRPLSGLSLPQPYTVAFATLHFSFRPLSGLSLPQLQEENITRIIVKMVSVPSRGYLFLNVLLPFITSARVSVSVPSRGYLFLNES